MKNRSVKDEAMDHLTNKVNHVKVSMLRIFMVAKQYLVQVFQHFFGPESSAHNFLKKYVNEFEDHAMFLQFLGTFLFLVFNDNSSTSLLKGMQSNEILVTSSKLMRCHINHVTKFGKCLQNLGLVK